MIKFFKYIVNEYLDPTERFAELLFGLIMVLTFTLGAGMIVQEGRGAARELLIATIGCNIAWGIIDAIICIVLRMSDRARRANLAEKIRSMQKDEDAIGVIKDELSLKYEDMFSPGLAGQISTEVLGHVRKTEVKKIRIEKSDLLAGLASCLLVFISTVPAALPFIFLRRAHFALRVSNLLLMGILFWLGWRWAGYTKVNRFVGGFSMTAIGAALVVIAILLGG